tara:strand:+ start:101 stop:529 length:429 start_codon:yes stop_codon:yes gene_type:complete
MLTKKVKKRISLISAFLILLILSVFFILNSLNQNILYFKTPTDINLSKDLKINKSIRVGGMVKKNSITANKDNIRFVITDFKNEILVSFSGTVPNLFLEGKGVIAEGKLKDKKYFIAEKILAKHDENYMPPELEGILKKNVK